MTTCSLCGEQVPADEITNHLRLFHPDEYGDGEIAEEIVDGETGRLIVGPGMETARVTIVRTLTEDDVIDVVEAVSPDGTDLPLTEALGMLRLAEDTLIRERMGEPQ